MSKTSSNPNWAEGPFPLIPTPCGPVPVAKEHASRLMAQEMTHIHNCILRVLNSIYNQAPYVKTRKDITSFLQLAKFWHDELEHHHGVEEEFFFPKIEEIIGQKGIMDGNVEQHHLFEPGLARLLKYATETSFEQYRAEDLRAVIDSFGNILQTHLNDEIKTLLGLAKYDSAVMKKVWDDTHQYALKSCNQQVQLPMILGAFDRTYEGKADGLALPWFLFYLVEYWFARKYRESWRYLPCTTWGKPQPLAAITEVRK